ncbi:Na(+)/H(+) exchange regulatory cofactor NHE-RF2 [Brachyhypopomus gauderio]|uniref:Na(+)/H(+) exchange regulatory cofactor NHE-RF2 n=1 Tax=Brachyhypopomus gauderio TaxID=698409 RepID=UPI0040429B58
MAGDLKPRLCCMMKGDSGYGFHLHGEKGKSGQYIRKVESGSPAEASGLRAGDRVVEVNGENVERETHHQVVQRIKLLEQETRLLVVDRQTDDYLRSLRLTCTEDMAAQAGPAPGPTPTPTPPPDKQENGSVSNPPAALKGEVPKPRRRSPSHAAKKEVQVPGQSSPSECDRVPRLCRLTRADTGYGFNLHSEKSRPGQYIRSLDPGSPADRAGLRPQDRLIEVNGVNIEGMRHAEVVAFIKRGGDETQLLVVDPDTDEHFKRLGITPTCSHAQGCQAQSIMNGTQSPRFNGRSTSQSTHSDHSSQDASTQDSEDGGSRLLAPFAEMGLKLSPTAAEAKEKAHAKRARKRAPHMDWNKKYELFSNF